MPTWLKIVLGILIGIIVICSGTAGACYFYTKGKFSDGATKAAEFGKTHNDQECYDEAIAQAKKCGKAEVMCLGKISFFTTSCTAEAAESPTLCDGYDANKSESWVDQKCEGYGMAKDDRCKIALSQLVIQCAGNAPSGTGTGTGTGTEGTEGETPPTDDMPKDEAPPADEPAK